MAEEKKVKSDFLKIKDGFGEQFAQFCRSNFPELIEQSKLYDLIIKEFVPNRFLYEDLVANNKENAFIGYIYSKENMNYRAEILGEIDSPENLMKKAGYILKKCNTPEEINQFRKYYAEGERICTFHDPERRLKFHTVFFALKDNVDDIKRENFKIPRRQDEYGTSVISIQFSKAKKNKRLKITNRYNHSVEHCDATFSNNLENIYPGLTESFRKYYDIDLSSSFESFEMPGYIRANDGKFYKYNYQINNQYYCPDNILIDDLTPITYNKGKYEMFDYFVLDKKLKMLYFPPHFDPFDLQFKRLKNIEAKKCGDGKIIKLYPESGEDFEIEIDKYSRIIRYKNLNLKQMPKYFLTDNIYLQKLETPNVEFIGDGVLANNISLVNIDLPKAISIGSGSFRSITQLESFNAPKLKKVGDNVFADVIKINEYNVPNDIEVGNNYFRFCKDVINFKNNDCEIEK